MTRFDPDIHGPELSAFLDGELDPQRAAAIQQLLAGSPEARAYLEELRTVANGLRALPRLSAPDALRASLRSHGPNSGGTGKARASWIIALRTGAIAAALGGLWIAGQNLVGPVNAPMPESAGLREAVVAGREKDERADARGGNEPTVALGVPAAVERESFRAPAGEPPAPSPTIAADTAAARQPATPPPAAPSGAGPVARHKSAETPVGGDLAGGRPTGETAIEAGGDLPEGQVEVVINARTPAEFNLVNDMLLSLQAPQLATNANYVARVAEFDGGEMHQLEVPRTELRSLVSQLEALAPQNVQVQRLDDVADGALHALTDEVATPVEKPPAARSAGGGADTRAQKKPAAAQRETGARAPARESGRGGRGESQSAPAGAQTESEVAGGRVDRKQQVDRAIQNFGRGGRIIYRAPSQRQLDQHRGARAQSAATRPDEADEPLVVNVLVAPPAPQQQNQPVQSQPAPRVP